MKKRTMIISAVAASLVTVGALSAVNAAQHELETVKENVAVAKSQEVAQHKEVNETNSPVASPEAPQETLEPEMSAVSTQEQESVTNAPMTESEIVHIILGEALTFERWGMITPPQIVNMVNKNILALKDTMTPELVKSHTQACIAYIKNNKQLYINKHGGDAAHMMFVDIMNPNTPACWTL